MDAQLLGLLSDFGALGLASGAIFWLYVKNTKRQDELIESFQEQLKSQMEECNKRESEIRDRYDEVIRKYDDERLESLREIGLRLQGIEKELEDMQRHADR